MKKEVYERMLAWMADYEDGSLLEEAMEDVDINLYLLEKAFDIMYDIHIDQVERHEKV